MIESFKTLALLMLLLAGSLFAQITPAVVSGGSWEGTTEYGNHIIRVNIQEGIADVEEEATLTAREGSWALFNPTAALEFSGTITFPANAAVVGMLLWNGNQILKAKLKSVFNAFEDYEEVVDRPTAQPPAPRDPALLIRIGRDEYTLRVFPAYLNAARKIRIRYLVPLSQESDSTAFNVTPVFPSTNAVTIQAQSKDADEITLSKNGNQSKLTVPGEVKLYDVQSLSIGSSSKMASLRTAFPSGEWAGSYWWINANIPRELVKKVNPRREVVILWRWNFPEQFLKDVNSGEWTGWASPYGDQALTQALNISAFISMASQSSDSLFFGLIHQVGPKETNVFPLGNNHSAELEATNSYLLSVNHEFIYQRFPPLKKQHKMDLSSIEKYKKQSQQDFQNLLEKAVTLYSPDSNTVKYVLVITAGPALNVETPTVEDLKTIPGLNGVQVGVADAYQAGKSNPTSWPGVDLPALQSFSENELRNFETISGSSMHSYSGAWGNGTVSGFQYPTNEQAYYRASYRDAGITKSIELPNEHDKLQLALHSSKDADSTITWAAYNRYGESLGSITQKIQSVTRPADSAIAKITAASWDMESYKYPDEVVGATWGVVRSDYSLVALESDTVSSIMLERLAESGLPYLGTDEIFLPEPVDIQSSIGQLISNFIVRPLGEKRIQFQVQGKLRQTLKKIEIFDVHGKRVASLDIEHLKRQGESLWNGEVFSKGIYIARVVAEGVSFQKKFILQ